MISKSSMLRNATDELLKGLALGVYRTLDPERAS
jgi:hypothetical protein